MSRLLRTFEHWSRARQQLPNDIKAIETVCLDLREQFPLDPRKLDLKVIDFAPLRAALAEHRLRIDFEIPGLLPPRLDEYELASFVVFVSSHLALAQLRS